MTPSMDDLRSAGVEARLHRMRHDFEQELSATRGGRTALRLSRWYMRLRSLMHR